MARIWVNIEKKDSFVSDEIERLVGLKITVGQPVDHRIKTNRQAAENVAQTAPVLATRQPKNNFGTYTFEDFSHLIRQKNSQKLVFNDGLEFLYALNQAKYEFNTTYQSEFLKNYNKKHNEYRSRRDELGGAISAEN